MLLRRIVLPIALMLLPTTSASDDLPLAIAPDETLTTIAESQHAVLELAREEGAVLVNNYNMVIALEGDRIPAKIARESVAEAHNADKFISIIPSEPTNAPNFTGIVIIGVFLVGLLSGRFVWPLFHRRQSNAASASATATNTAVPQKLTRAPPRPLERDLQAEQAILRIVRKYPAVTGRRLRERLRMSTERITAAVDALVGRGALVRKGSTSKWHLFEPSEGLDENWERQAALQEINLRLTMDLLEESPDAEQRHFIAVARERLNWSPSTTRDRLRRLAAVGLAKATESGLGRTRSVSWSPITRTEKK